MELKNKILITIAILIVMCLVLGMVILHVLNREEILQSSTYTEMFGSQSMRQDMSPMESGIIENMTLDIVRISDEVNGTAMATVNVTIPDVPTILIETVESFPDIDNIDESVLDNKFTANMQNHFITLRKEVEVVQQGGRWQIADEDFVDNLIDEQISVLFVRILEHTDFEPMALPSF